MDQIELRIHRTEYEKAQTLGKGWVLKNGESLFEFKTLELPWLNNEKQISCIPLGAYECVKRSSLKYKDHFHILNVPNRSWILIHHGNYFRDTLGCILVGRTLSDIDGDGFRDVTHSKQTMAKLNELLPDKFEVVILDQINLTT